MVEINFNANEVKPWPDTFSFYTETPSEGVKEIDIDCRFVPVAIPERTVAAVHQEIGVNGKNIKGRAKFGGNADTRLLGGIAEHRIKEYFGFDPNISIGHYDIEYAGMRIDIKATVVPFTPTWDDYKNNLCALQTGEDRECDAYIFSFICLKLRLITINGWIKKGEAVNNKWFFKKNSKRPQAGGRGGYMIVQEDMYELMNDQFLPIELLVETNWKLHSRIRP